MSYDFGKKKIGAREKQERNGGMYSKTLLGQSIVENVVPSWTADGENRPFVVFRDPDTGNVFGLSKDMLAYGFLAIGAPGTGGHVKIRLS